LPSLKTLSWLAAVSTLLLLLPMFPADVAIVICGTEIGAVFGFIVMWFIA
jgi:hypothetical protein